jgi:hypothetical protein
MSIKEKKSISRSVRMTQTVYDIVDSFEGNGFNEKFQNLVLYCFKEKEKVRKDIKFMQDRAKRNEREYQKRMEQNSTKLEAQQDILNKLNMVSYYVDSLLHQCELN